MPVPAKSRGAGTIRAKIMEIEKAKELLRIAETKCLCTDDRLRPLKEIRQALAELEQPEPEEFIEVQALSADFEEDTVTFKLPVGFWHTHEIRVGKAKISIGDAIIIAQEQSK